MVDTFWDHTLAHSPYLHTRVSRVTCHEARVRLPGVVDPLDHLLLRVKHSDAGHGPEYLLLHAPGQHVQYSWYFIYRLAAVKVICCSLSPVLVRDAGDDGGLDEAARPVVGRQLQLGLAGVQLSPGGGPGQLQVAHHLDIVIHMVMK